MRHVLRQFRSIPLLALLASSAAAQDAAGGGGKEGKPNDGALLRVRPYTLPPFDSLGEGIRRDVAREVSREEYDRLRRDTGHELRKLEYASDGLRVVAYTYGSSRTNALLPVIVYNRGSFVAADVAPVLLPTMSRLARGGFLVVAPQYRQSDGGEGKDEMGGADVSDVLNAVRLARTLPGADSARVFMYGESRGGMMAYQAVRDGAVLRAVAVVGAFTDLDSLLAGDPRSRGAATAIWPDFDRDHDTIAPRRSAVRWADEIRVPLLMLHGANDTQVSPRQSMRLALQLDAGKRQYELHVIADGSHTLRERGAARDSLIMAWFRKHER